MRERERHWNSRHYIRGKESERAGSCSLGIKMHSESWQIFGCVILFCSWKPSLSNCVVLISEFVVPGYIAKIWPEQVYLQEAPSGIDLNGKSDKIEFMCFNQEGVISSINSNPLKLIDQFIFLNSNISSTENYVNICIGKAWTTINMLTAIWKSDLW